MIEIYKIMTGIYNQKLNYMNSFPRMISDWNTSPSETIMNLRTSVSLKAD